MHAINVQGNPPDTSGGFLYGLVLFLAPHQHYMLIA